MKIWVDAQLSPHLAPWLNERFGVEAIFAAARETAAVVMTKDRDFLNLLDIHGPPPKVIWITMGNTSNAHMKTVLDRVFAEALVSLREGESIVEITDLIR